MGRASDQRKAVIQRKVIPIFCLFLRQAQYFCCDDYGTRHVAYVGLLTTALLLSRRIGVAAVGRHLPVSTTPKHAIKRVDRFLGNPRFRLLKAWEALLPSVIGPRQEVMIAWDGTKVRQWPVLSASVIYRGRALPIFWAVLDPRQLHNSLNSFEHGFFTVLAHLLPR
jgi:hypothetical protein